MEAINKVTPENFTRVNSDMYGNPRYVVHFLHFANKYDEAKEIANSLGGAKYRGKNYGGGFVFQSYSLPDLCASINEAKQV